MKIQQFMRMCIPISANLIVYNSFQLISLAFIASLGSSVVVLAGSASTAIAVFVAILDGARLAIVQDTARKQVTPQYLFVILRVGLGIVLLFGGFFLVWFPSIVGQYSTHYNIFWFEIMAIAQVFFMMFHYFFTGLLYGSYKEKWVTYITFVGSASQCLLIALFVFTDLVPLPKYLATVNAASLVFALQCIVEFILIIALRRKTVQKQEQAQTSVITFLRSSFPISIERAGLLLGFLFVFSALRTFSADEISGYVFITRIVALAYQVAYGVEVVLTREVNKKQLSGENIRVLRLSLLAAMVLGGIVVLLEALLNGPLIHFELPHLHGNSFFIIRSAFFCALLFQFVNFGQIILSGFLRALNQKLFVSLSNIIIFMIIMPICVQLLQWPISTLPSLWICIGLIYSLALIIFCSKLIFYIRKQTKYEIKAPSNL